MINIAGELNIKLDVLTLAGQNEDGELEWIGTDEQWNRIDYLTNKLYDDGVNPDEHFGSLELENKTW